MFKLARSVCALQNICNKNVAVIFKNKKSLLISISKSNYASGAKKIPQPINSNLSNVEDTENLLEKKKKFTSPKITVLSTDSKLTVMTLEEAQKLSKRRDLKLVKVMDVDHKTHRPVYKLMTGTEYFQEDLLRRKEKSSKKNNESKDPKLLTLSTKISDHDLGSKMRNINKWLNKRHEVRIVINAGGDDEAAENIYKTIETETKTYGKSVQKRMKDGFLKFQLVSLRNKNEVADEKSSSEADKEIEPTPGS